MWIAVLDDLSVVQVEGWSMLREVCLEGVRTLLPGRCPQVVAFWVLTCGKSPQVVAFGEGVDVDRGWRS